MGFLSSLWRSVKGFLRPSKPRPAGVNIEKSGTNQEVPIIYGFNKKSPCIKVFKATTDKKGGAKNEYLHFICVFTVGEIEGIGNLYFNDIPQSQISSERYFIKKYNGSDNQTYCTELATEFNQWKSTAKLKNIAYAYVRLKQNKDVNWWQGEPNISADIKGLKVLDIRDGQRKYSDNAALCTYDYLTNVDYGKGLAVSKLDTQSFINAANFIETTREYTRTIKRTYHDRLTREWFEETVGTFQELVVENIFSCNVNLPGDNTIKENIETLLGGMRAIMPESNGKYRIAIQKDDQPVFDFTKDNIIGAINVKGGSQSERYNQVIIKFRNKLTGEGDEVVYPENDSLHQEWKAQDNGRLLLGQFDYDTINNKAEALQMGHVIANRSRHLIGALFNGTAETMVVEAGDIVTLDSTTTGWVAKPFRIESVTLDLSTGVNSFQAVEHQPSIYPWAIGDVVEEYKDTSHALPQDINAPTGLSYETLVDGDIFIGKLSWDDPNDVMVTGYSIDVENAESNDIVFSQETSELNINIARLPEGQYTVSVTAKNSLYVSEAAILVFNVALPGLPTVSIDSVSSNSVSMSARIEGITSLNTTFQWQFIGTDEVFQDGNIVQGPIFTFTGLFPESDYKFKCRSINVAGSSSWIDVSVTTTASDMEIPEDLQIQLDSIPERWDSIASDLSGIFTTALISKETITAKEGLAESYRDRDIKLSTLNADLKGLINGKFPITSTQISDNSISTGALMTNSVTTQKILARSISSDKIAVNGVVANNIAANAITTDKIKAGAIIAELIGANSILAVHVAAGSITTEKLVSNIIIGNEAIFAGRLQAATGDFSGDITAHSLTMSGRFFAQSGDNKIDFNPATGKCDIETSSITMKGGNGASFKVSENNQGNTAFRFADSAGTTRLHISDGGVISSKAKAGSQLADFIAAGQSTYGLHVAYPRAIFSSGGVLPFTGRHLGVMYENVAYVIGDIMVRLTVLIKADINNSISRLGLSDKHKQKTCYGVISEDVRISEHLNDGLLMGLDPESVNLNDRLITINSVGEGLINVCGLGGDIENGDNLCSSLIPGKAQLQGDDLLYNYTVAESHENITFDYPEQVKQIACTYKF